MQKSSRGSDGTTLFAVDDGEGQTLGFRVGTEQLVDWKAGRGVERTDGKAMEGLSGYFRKNEGVC